MKNLIIAFTALSAFQMSSVMAAERDVIDRARVAFDDQLQLSCSVGGEYDWIADNAVYQYPLHDINVKLRVEGRDAVAEHLRALAEIEPSVAIENISFYPTLKPDVVFVRYEVVKTDSAEKRRPVVAIIEMRGNQIAGFTQLNSTDANLQVMQAATAGHP